MEDDIKNLVQLKKDVDEHNSQIIAKLNRKQAKNKYLKESLLYREQELE